MHSSVIRLTMAPRLEELQVEEEPFIAFLKLAFAQKRKTLANNLRGQYDAAAIRAALKAPACAPMCAPKPCRWRKLRRYFVRCERRKLDVAVGFAPQESLNPDAASAVADSQGRGLCPRAVSINRPLPADSIRRMRSACAPKWKPTRRACRARPAEARFALWAAWFLTPDTCIPDMSPEPSIVVLSCRGEW